MTTNVVVSERPLRVIVNPITNVVTVSSPGPQGPEGPPGTGGGTGAAVDVTYDNTVSGLTATDVQAAIDELAASPGGGSGTPGGANTQVQFNDAGAFGGDATFTYDKSIDLLRVKSWRIWDGTNDLFGARSTNPFNTFIGRRAGENSATDPATAGGDVGTANTAIGYESQRFATTAGRYNTSIGTHSLNGIVNGEFNTGLGANAGLTLTTGGSNTLVGHDAGGNCATGINNNVFLGRRAGNTAASSNNVGIGYEAIKSVSGDGNVAIGYNVGTSLTSGQYNVLLGLSAGNTPGSQPALTTGSGNILVGVYATPSVASAAGECVLGSEFTPITNVYFGKGASHPTPVGVTVQPQMALGTNLTGVDLTLAGGKGTGTGAGGAVRIKAAPAGSSGSTPGTLQDVIVASTGGVVVGAAAGGAKGAGTVNATGLYVDGTLVSGGGASSPSGAYVYRDASGTGQLMQNATPTACQFNVESVDDSGYANLGTNNDRVTVPATGWYAVNGTVHIAANSTGMRGSWFTVNGSATDRYGMSYFQTNSTGATQAMSSNAILHLTAGDYVQLIGYQAAGADLNLVLGNNLPYLSIHRLS